MSISGNLKTMELSELLQWIAQGGKTGNLLIDNGTVRKRIYFVRGQIVASASTDPSEYLGHFLVSHGFITEPELAKAMEIQSETGMLLGKILSTIGAIADEELQRLLVMKTQESVYDVFFWKEGEFRFVDDETLDKGNIPMALDVQALVLQGINRLDEWKRIREAIPNAEAVPVSLGDIPAEELPPSVAKVAALIDDDRTVREICMQAHASEFHVSQSLFFLQQQGLVKVVRARGTAPSQGRSLVASAPGAGSATAMAVVSSDALIESADRHLVQGNFAKALRHLRAALSLEPDCTKVEKHLKKAESHIRTKLGEEGLSLDAVPVLERSVDELTSLDLTPEEGFALSRINGSYDIESLIKISPMNTLDAQLVIRSLYQSGHISIANTSAVRSGAG